MEKKFNCLTILIKELKKIVFIAGVLILLASSCKDKKDTDPSPPKDEHENGIFYFGADLSYVNQILDHNGVYKDNGAVKDPYKIFADRGTNLARFRLWHNPAWTKEVYGDQGTQLYNDLYDVEKSIRLAKAEGMEVLLDFHYSDTWADPGKQHIPAAWMNIKDIAVLKDSVYNYTYKTLQYLNQKGLLPELVQLGNETNCGFLYTDAPAGFPACNVCNGGWSNMGTVLNAGVKAVKDVTATTAVKTKIILHVADPKTIDWWFDNVKSRVPDFDMIGFSYYPLWHTTVSLDQISERISAFKSKFNKDIIILETAYPWTTQHADSYNNLFGEKTPLNGYPFTEKGQYDFLVKLTQEVKEGGGIGLVYWEPAWITSNMKDLWGTGSSWENCTFFDFNGNTHKGIEYMKFNY
jgi:arabinogalactan endo-1,4-beta-galactosidase